VNDVYEKVVFFSLNFYNSTGPMIVVAYVTGLFRLRQRVIVQLRLLMLNYFVERAF